MSKKFREMLEGAVRGFGTEAANLARPGGPVFNGAGALRADFSPEAVRQMLADPAAAEMLAKLPPAKRKQVRDGLDATNRSWAEEFDRVVEDVSTSPSGKAETPAEPLRDGGEYADGGLKSDDIQGLGLDEALPPDPKPEPSPRRDLGNERMPTGGTDSKGKPRTAPVRRVRDAAYEVARAPETRPRLSRVDLRQFTSQVNPATGAPFTLDELASLPRDQIEAMARQSIAEGKGGTKAGVRATVGRSAADVQQEVVRGAAGFDPSAPPAQMVEGEDIARMSNNDLPKLDQRPTQAASARSGDALEALNYTFREHAPSIMRGLAEADDAVAAEIAYGVAEDIVNRMFQNTERVSPRAHRDAVHGVAASLLEASGRQIGVLPDSVFNADIDAIRATEKAFGDLSTPDVSPLPPSAPLGDISGPEFVRAGSGADGDPVEWIARYDATGELPPGAQRYVMTRDYPPSATGSADVAPARLVEGPQRSPTDAADQLYTPQGDPLPPIPGERPPVNPVPGTPPAGTVDNLPVGAADELPEVPVEKPRRGRRSAETPPPVETTPPVDAPAPEAPPPSDGLPTGAADELPPVPVEEPKPGRGRRKKKTTEADDMDPGEAVEESATIVTPDEDSAPLVVPQDPADAPPWQQAPVNPQPLHQQPSAPQYNPGATPAPPPGDVPPWQQPWANPQQPHQQPNAPQYNPGANPAPTPNSPPPTVPPPAGRFPGAMHATGRFVGQRPGTVAVGATLAGLLANRIAGDPLGITAGDQTAPGPEPAFLPPRGAAAAQAGAPQIPVPGFGETAQEQEFMRRQQMEMIRRMRYAGQQGFTTRGYWDEALYGD
jgi:hypothetical protein